MYFPERPREALFGEPTLTPHQWVYLYHSDIEKTIMQYFYSHKYDIDGLYDQRLSLEKRTISELPICRAMYEVVKTCSAPRGYRITDGYITYRIGKQTVYDSDHVFFTKRFSEELNDPRDEIACLFSGQVIGANNPLLSKGERIYTLQTIATEHRSPGSIHCFNDELALLTGTRREIEKIFGMEFRDKEIDRSD